MTYRSYRDSVHISKSKNTRKITRTLKKEVRDNTHSSLLWGTAMRHTDKFGNFNIFDSLFLK